MSSRRFFLAGGALLLLAASCASLEDGPRADWGRLEQEGRIATDARVLEARRKGDQYVWSDGTVVLGAEYAPHPLGRGLRLTTYLQSQRGESRTQFILDTASSASWLSWGAPLMADVHASPERVVRVVYGSPGRGHWAYAPTVFMGSLRGTDLAVVLEEVEHSLGSGTNILGFRHFFHTQMEHVGDRWLLRSGQDRAAVVPEGWHKVAFIPGLPLVRVRDPAGRETIAILDTGAPENYALKGAVRGTYALPIGDTKTSLPLRVLKTAPYPVTTLWGHKVTLLIGMEWLAAHNWRMTFDKATWAFAP